MDNKGLLLGVLALALVGAFFGWREHQRAQLKELMIVKEQEMKALMLAEESKRMAYEAQLRTEEAAQREKEKQEENQRMSIRFREQIQDKKISYITEIRALIDQAKTMNIEKHENGQVWTRQLQQIQLTNQDSLFAYTYQQANKNIEYGFVAKDIEQIQESVEENVYVIEITARGGNKLFEQCEKNTSAATCTNVVKVNRVKIYAHNAKVRNELKDKFTKLKMLYTEKPLNLQVMLDRGEL